MDDAQYAKLMQQAVRIVSVAYVIEPDDNTGKFLPVVGDLKAEDCPDLLVALSMVAVSIARAAEANGCTKGARELIQEVAMNATSSV